MKTPLLISLKLALSLILFAFYSQAQTVVEFNSPGTFTWTPPPGCTNVQAEIWGGGAGGNASWGGGGGGYSKTILYTITGTQSFSVEVGAGGFNGANGGESKFNGVPAAAGRGNGQSQYAWGGGPIIQFYYSGNGGSGTAVSCWCVGGYASGGGGGSAYSNGNGASGTNGFYDGCSFFDDNNVGSGGAGTGAGGNGGQNGTFPGGGGGSSNLNCVSGGVIGTYGGNGKVKITYYCNSTPGTIGNAHTITSPVEKDPDYITNVTSATGYGIVYSWEMSTNNSTWTPATGSTNSSSYQIPTNLTQDTWFRRRTNSCSANTASNSVLIKVFTTSNGFKKGRLRGKVKSVNGTPVAGIQITAQKTINLLGSSQSFTYVTTTDSTNGTFDIPGIFYGDPNYGSDPSPVSFTITPYKLNHVFSSVQVRNFTNVAYDFENVDFTDSTVYAITGKTYQECTSCVDINGVPQALIEGSLDSVLMYRNGSYITSSGYIDPPAAFGRWATTVTDPLNYTFSPSYNGHVFVPASWSQIVTDNVANVNFKDTTTHVVSGFLRAGCNDYLGRVELEFADVRHDLNGQPYSVFRKRVITNAGSGFYSVRLPARKYKVRVIDFTQPAITDPQNPDYIYETDLQAFFNTNFDTTISSNALPYDSLLVDLTTTNDSLNLVYQRPPSISLYGLLDNCNLPDYVRWKQAELKDLGFVVYQGSPAKGCRLSLDSVRLSTNVHVQDVNEVFMIPVVNDTAKITLKAGEPNVLSPYYKVFFATYKDSYNRVANQTLTGEGITKNVIVTGIKSDVGFFTTVSPELPVMVVHDPPGDLSYSTWSSSETNETAMRWNVAAGIGVERFASVKLGTKIQTGLGISTEAEFWGTINNKLSVNTRFNGGEESIMTTTSTQTISTSSDENTIGADGDLFMGGAVNLLYSIATVISDSATCYVSKTRKLIIAQDGFATNYYYTDADIRNSVLPTLQNFVNNPGNTAAQIANYTNQISLWQQILASNEFNKARAAFEQNISFFGSSGPLSFSTTTSSTKTSSFDFNLEIENSVAVELGLEVAGSGINGGATVAFKMETGVSTSNTTTEETTIGYTLDDNEPADNFSVNIKKDPVYNTPVFETVAGQSSCPPEDNTYHRDAMQLIIPIDIVSGVAPNGDAIFTLLLGNLSQDAAPRTYNLTFDQSSNPDGASVFVGGSPVIGGVPTPYTIAFGGQVTVNVVVKKNIFSNVYSYEGLRFTLSDDCDGSISKSGTISAHFIAPCSAINLVTPEDNWIHRITDNNIIPVQFDGYVLNNLTSVSLEYSSVGTSNWSVGFIRSQAQISIGSNGTSVNWDVSLIPDGQYKVRLKLTCPSGTIYTNSVTGIIDRVPPSLFGLPEPNDNNFIVGDFISFNYDEDLTTSGLNNNVVTMTRMSNNGILPVTVSGYGNKISITPSVNLMQFAGDSIQVVVYGVKDIYGNVRTTPDTLFFVIGPFIPGSGPKTANVAISFSPKFENATGTMNAVFSLPASATVPTRVNYTIGGTATYGDDYSIDSTATSRLSGVEGYVIIPQGSTQASVLIDPAGDNLAEQDETINFTIIEGGDYVIGANFTATATILSDDLLPPAITLIGSSILCVGDSVKLVADSVIDRRFANTVLNFSSENNVSGGTTSKILGAVNVYPNYGDNSNSWSPNSADATREHLVLAFDNPAPINFVDIYETFNPGAIDTVYVKNPGTGLFQVVYTATAAPSPPVARILHITFPTTLFAVNEIRIAMNSIAVPDFNQIDAVSIGNAYTNYIWSNGTLAKSITVNTGGTYSVIVSNSYGITATSLPVVITTSSGNSTWYVDADGDNYGNAAIDSVSCNQPVGYVLDNTDCDDSFNTVYPAATEICDNLDNDCDGLVDENLPLFTYYWDGDGDGHGANFPITVACSVPVGYAYANDDCNDAVNTINPGALEICNSIDDNCNGLIDSDDPGVYGESYWYVDADADGFGNFNTAVYNCTQPFGYIADGTDCDDQDSDVNPLALEICNNIDDDCDGLSDDVDPSVVGQNSWYIDADGDGWGALGSTPVVSCMQPSGWIGNGDDCNDLNNVINPGALELCNLVDDNCDGLIDDADAGIYGQTYWNADADGDGFGDLNILTQTLACFQPVGYTNDYSDCDDQNPNINVAAQEVCGNGFDDDCDGQIDEFVTVSIESSGETSICTGDSVTLSSSFLNNTIRYASGVTDFSSEFNDEFWDANQALGTPNTYPQYGDIPTAWASSGSDNQREFIQLSYDDPSPISFIDIYETFSPGAVDTVYVKNPNTGLFEIVYTSTASLQPAVARILHIAFPLTSFDVSEIRIALNSPAVPDWNEIDAVAIGEEPNYLWSTGATTSSIVTGASGLYSLTVSNGLCQSTSGPIEIIVLPAPTDWYVDADQDGFGVEGSNTVVLDAVSEVTLTGEAVAFDLNQDYTLAQSFTASQTGTFNNIQFNVETVSDGSFDAQFELYSGAVPGTGALLFSQTYTITSTGWQSIGIPSNIVATSGNSYYFVIKGAGLASDFMILWRSNTTTPGAHAGGSLYYYDGVFQTWNAFPDDDLDFREYINVVSGTGPAITSCANPGNGYVNNSLDCNDADLTVNPNSLEVCSNLIDDNCNGIIDTDAVYYTWYQDNDFDNYGNLAVSLIDCNQPFGYVFDSTDCNDNNYDVYPNATEYCDYIDNNCDGQIDEGVFYTVWPDADQDEYGNSQSSPTITCSPMIAASGSLNNLDCDDSNYNVNPSVAEVCDNSIDDNCDGEVDVNNALAFDGTSFTEGVVSSIPQGNSARTMESWIKTTSDGMVILNWGNTNSNERCGMIVYGGRLYFVGENNDDIGNIVINDGLWHHVAVTYDGNSLKGYVDGVLDINSTKTLNTTGNVLRIGRRAVPDDGEYYVGEMDEVRIWNVERTQAEIQSSMVTSSTAQPGLIAYYKMDDGVSAGSNGAVTSLHDVNMNMGISPLSLVNFNLSNGNTTSNFVANSILLYQDADGDGFGNPSVTSSEFCGSGYVRNNTDCDDGLATSNPNAIEICGNSIDDNCNGSIDEGCCTGVAVTTSALFEDFESGALASGWSATGLWHVSSACSSGTPPNPTQWAYYGNDGSCSFNTGGTNSGDLTSSTVSIPATASRATLRFSYIYNGEAGSPPFGYDNASVLLSVNGDPFVQAAELSTTGSQGLTWLTSEIDLSAYAGSTIAVRWNFNSADAWYNDVLGLQIDSVALTYQECQTVPAAALNLKENDFVSITPVPSVDNNNFTIEAWIKTTDSEGNIVGWGGDGLAEFRLFNGKLQFLMLGSSSSPGFQFVNTSSIINNDVWTHVAVAKNGSDVKLFVNGVEEGSTTMTLQFTYTYFYIGSGGPNLTVNLEGSMDELRIWNTAKTASEILAKMNCELPSAVPDLTANYHFNQGDAGGINPTVNILVDSSGNGNNGALQNFNLFGAISNWVAPGAVVSGVNCLDATTAAFHITALFEGFYAGSGTMLPVLFNSGLSIDLNECDTVYLELRDALSPSNTIASASAIIGTNGQFTCALPASLVDQSGYIVVVHRNAIQTWSNLITFTDPTIYNFTTDATQAFGSNQREVEPGVWAFYSGDIAPQDEVADITDQGYVGNDIFNFESGYKPTDISGDGVVDITDQAILDNNIINFVGSIHP